MESTRPIYIVELIDAKGWDFPNESLYGPEARVHLLRGEALAVVGRLNIAELIIWEGTERERALEAAELPVFSVIEITLNKLRALVEELRRGGRGYCEIEPGLYYDASESDLEDAEALVAQLEA